MNILEEYLLKESRYYDHDTKYKVLMILDTCLMKMKMKIIMNQKLINTAFKNNYFQYQSASDRKNMLSPNEYFKMSETHLTEMINKNKNYDSCKIQLTMKISFTPLHDFNDKRSLFLKTKIVVIMMGSDTNETVKELCDSLIKKYQELLEYSTRNSGPVLEGVESMTYDINKTTINGSGSYTESPTWLKNKKCAINLQNENDNKCFQYSITATLNYEKINNHPEKISKITPFSSISIIGMI